jgi:excisionase family DNA binding protein
VSEEELLTVAEVAERLGLSRYTVRVWINEGKLGAVKMGKSWRIRERALAAVVDPQADPTSEHEPLWEGAQEGADAALGREAPTEPAPFEFAVTSSDQGGREGPMLPPLPR